MNNSQYLMRTLASFLFASMLLTSCAQQGSRVQQDPGETAFVDASGDTITRIIKSPDEWKSVLSEEEFRILRQKGTERAFTGDLWDNKKKGIYTCAGCGLPLFSSDTKYRSGSGWPSFYQPLDAAHILEHDDRTLGVLRTEVLCRRCNGHLGHVFEDGPEPTGLRYCINSAALDFEKEKPGKKE